MKKIYFALLFVLALFIGALSINAYDIAVQDENGNVYNHDNYQFYLPSHISPTEVELLVDSDTTFSYLNNGEFISITSGQKIDVTPFNIGTDEVPNYMMQMKINDLDGFLLFRFASSLPSVYVETSVGSQNIIEYEYKDTGAKTTITNKNGVIEYKDTQTGNSEFKIRGNTTRDYAKKPFQLKLSEKGDLFGMGRSKTWILLANYLDQSLLRNSVMYEIGKYLGMQTCDFTSVDLYIDGYYHGIYLLCEKVQISSNRLNIHELEKDNDLLNSTYNQYATHVTSGDLINTTILTQYSYIDGVTNPSDITGGYLVELDNNYYKDELCYFTTENGNHYVIKSPEYASRQEVEYIARLFAEMEEAIMSYDGYNSVGKHYSDYIDIDSFAVAYIVAELGRNYDAGSSSMYFYKDRDVDGQTSKIFKGPLWDCDNTLGNIHKNSASSTEGYWAQERSIWAGLTQKSEFNALVTEKFENAYDYIFDMIDKDGFIDKEVEKIGSSIYMEQKLWGTNSYSRWPLYYDGTHYDKWQNMQVFNFVSVYSQGNNENSSTVIGYLCEHIEARANWLASEWGCDVTLRERDFTAKEPIDTDNNTDTETDTDTEYDSNIDSSTGSNTDTSVESDNDASSDFETDASTDVGTDTENDVSTDMTPDFEEPPSIDEQPKKMSFIERLFFNIIAFFKNILHFLGII